MLKLKKNVLPIMSAVALIGIIAMGILYNLTIRSGLSGNDYYITKYITNMLIAVAVFILVALFLKDSHIHKLAMPLAVIIIVVWNYMIISGNSYWDYLYLGGISLMTSAFVPFVLFWSVRLINKQQTVSVWQLTVALCPVIAAIICMSALDRNRIALIIFVFLWIMIIKYKTDGKIRVHWGVIAAAAVAVLTLAIVVVTESPYISERLHNIFTRGQADPLGVGWVRITVDDIFVDSSFFKGCIDLTKPVSEEYTFIFDNFDMALVSFIATYGWFSVVCLTVLYIVFFAGVFLMVKKTRQSRFAHDISFMSAAYIFMYTVYSYADTFLLECAGVGSPFLCISTQDIIYVILFGIIVSLYLKRDNESELCECDEDSYSESENLFEKIKSIFVETDYDDEEESYNENIETDRNLFYISTLSGCNMPWQIFRTIRVNDDFYHLFMNRNGRYGILKQFVTAGEDVYYSIAESEDIFQLADYMPDDLSEDEMNGLQYFAKSLYIKTLFDDNAPPAAKDESEGE